MNISEKIFNLLVKILRFEELDFSKTGIKNVDFLKGLKNLKKLNFEGCRELEDISSLSGCKNLEELNLRETKVIDLSPLKDLKKLKEVKIDKRGDYKDLSGLRHIKDLELDFSGTSIKNVNFLKGLRNLKKLNLEGCKELEDISALSELENLEELDLRGTKVIDLSPLKNLRNLKEVKIDKRGDYKDLSGLRHIKDLKLDFLGTHIKNVDFLKGLKNLKKLNLGLCEELEDISGLSELENLEELDLSYTKIKNVNFLKGLKNLKELDLYKCYELEDISGLSGLEILEELDLGRTKIKNLKALKNLENLRILNLEECKVLQDISGIKDLPKLEEINIKGCPSIKNIDVLSESKSLRYLEHDSPYVSAKILIQNAINRKDKKDIEYDIDEWVGLLESASELEPLLSRLINALMLFYNKDFVIEKFNKIVDAVLKRENIEAKSLENLLSKIGEIGFENYKEIFEKLKTLKNLDSEIIGAIIYSFSKIKKVDQDWALDYVNDFIKSIEDDNEKLKIIYPDLAVLYTAIERDDLFYDLLNSDFIKKHSDIRDKIYKRLIDYAIDMNNPEDIGEYLKEIKSDYLKDIILKNIVLYYSKTNPKISGNYFDKIKNKEVRKKLAIELIDNKEFTKEISNQYRLFLELEEERELYLKLIKSLLKNHKTSKYIKLILKTYDIEPPKEKSF